MKMHDRIQLAATIVAGILADPAVMLNTTQQYEAVAAQALLLADTIIILAINDASVLEKKAGLLG